MLVMIDNYDSFVYNLAAYFEELNQDIKVIRNDKLTIEELESIENLDGVIISPGPGRPQDGGVSLDIVRHFAGKTSNPGCMLWTSDYRTCLWRSRKKRNRSNARKSNTDSYHPKQNVFQPSGNL